MRTEVYSGWIELREPNLVPERLRRPVFEKSVSGQSLVEEGKDLDESAMKFFSEFNDLLAIALISAWSFEGAISVESLMDLPSKTYDDIRKVVTPYVAELIPDFGIDPENPKAIIES
jgi:hypothetical protein